MKLVLASKNAHKLVEMKDILSQLGVEVVLESEAGVDVDVEETGATFEENAYLKAHAVMEASGLPAIADDSGLCVDTLNGAPGVYSARYSEDMPDLPGATKDERNTMKLLAALSSVRLWNRSARFRSVVAVCTPEGETLIAPGTWEGSVACSPHGKNGFGYDPLFLVEDAQGSFIGEVRAAYCDALSAVAEACFAKTVFQSGYSQSVIEYARNTYGDELEFLWEKSPKNAILRRKDNRKWYAALLTISKSKLGAFPDEEIEVLDLRAAPEAIPDMVDGKRVFAGYHMNKKHWITIPLDGTLPAEEICAMLDTSYALAKGK